MLYRLKNLRFEMSNRILNTNFLMDLEQFRLQTSLGLAYNSLLCLKLRQMDNLIK